MSNERKLQTGFWPSFLSFLRRLVGPLRSRKVRVAVATTLGALVAEYGLEVSGELLLVIVGTGASLILGIAHEDAGRHAASPPQQPARTRARAEQLL